MEIVPATQEQIARFKVAAAQRYAERGVKPELADKLFELQLSKMASELGVELKAGMCAAHKGKAKKKKKLSKKAELLAGQICKALGRERKSE